MARVIKTNKKDIQTGFDLKFSVMNLFSSTKQVIKQALVANGYDEDLLNDEAYRQIAESRKQQLVAGLNNIVEEAEEIFLEEASLSRWSGNMVDNSVVAVAGKMPTAGANSVSMDVRIGVSKKAISTGNGAWSSRPVLRRRANSTGTVYEYNGYKMHPGVDYSQFLDEGTARIPNAARWAGFVKRAEDRVDAL